MVQSKQKKVKSNCLSLNLDEQIWPLENNVMCRPDRIKYVRRLVQPKDCVFCVAQQKRPSPKSLLLFENKYAMAILNRYPYNTGHLLVLPVRHVGEMSKMKVSEYRAVMDLLRKSVEILQMEYKCEGLNVGINLGRVAGAGIPEHLHIHVIPRWYGDTNFFPLIAQTKTVVETIEQTYKRLLPYFKKL